MLSHLVLFVFLPFVSIGFSEGDAYFLGASKRLYNSLRWLVRWLVGPLVGWSPYCFSPQNLVPGLLYNLFSFPFLFFVGERSN
jgi:hypothetical protein